MAKPDHELTLARNVVAFGVGNVDPAPGAELVLFAPSVAAAAFWAKGSARPTYRRLTGDVRFLWQPASPRRAFAWQRGVRDLNDDGLDDLLLPEPNSYRIAIQRAPDVSTAKAPRFAEPQVLRVPPSPATDRSRGRAHLDTRNQRFELSFAASDATGDETDGIDSLPLIDVSDQVPAPQIADWNGDGRLDLCVLQGQQLTVWTQSTAGTFDRPKSFPLPDRNQSIINPSYNAQITDLNGDARADLVLVTGQTVDDEVRSTVEVFLGGDSDGPLAGGTKATDRLRLQGFVSPPCFDDVDGDGRPDLAIGSLRPDGIAGLTGGGNGAVEAQVNLFHNAFGAGRNRFKRPVWLVHKVTIEDMQEGRRPLARFLADVDRDGRADLLVRAKPERLRVLRTVERGRRLAIGSSLWELGIHKKADVRALRVGKARFVVVRERRQVVLVEF